MNPILQNVLAVAGGWIIGGIVNYSLILLGHTMFPIAGIDPNDMEAMAEIAPSLSMEHYIFPFLAHAIGTLIGAFIAARFSAFKHFRMAMVVGFIFLFGGISVAMMIPAPTWFIIVDLVVAYIPMAWLGWKLGGSK